MSLEAGRMIGESLRLSRLVGRGAMGSVWVADHLGLHSEVAVKFMAQSMLEDPVSLRRFQQEAKAAAEIRSPHVVRVFDHGTTEDGIPYIVMELLEGESLERRLKRLGPMSLVDGVTVVRQCCKALAKAHERGIVHRDIKPGNIFLSSDDELFAKVVDFGVAKFSGQEAIEMTAQGNMVGTPAYMSPEQLFHGKSIDHRGDLWSLAVVAYQSLTGERPFDGVTLGELCVAIKRGEFVPASKLRPELGAEVDAWFAKAFAADIDARFQSARELGSALEVATGVGGLTSSTPSMAGPSASGATYPGLSAGAATFAPSSARSGRGARAVALLALGAVVLVAGVVALLLQKSDGAATEPREHGVTTTSQDRPREAADRPAADPVGTMPSATTTAEALATSATPPSASSGAPPARNEPTKGGASWPPRAPSAAPKDGVDGDERTKRAGEQLGI